MNRIAFYISDHGFGHAARNIAIIESLMEQDENLYITIKTGSSLINFMGRSLNKYSPRISYHPMNTDIGLVLKLGTMEIDREALLAKLKKFISTWDSLIEQEKEWLGDNKIDLVVSDIVPWVFKSARLAEIKSVFISNFTWIEIYKELFEEKVFEEYLHCYQDADLALLYPLVGDISGHFEVSKNIGMSCRSFNDKNVREIKVKYKIPIIYMSVGRSVDLQCIIDVGGLPYQFIYTEGIKLKGKNTELLPIEIDNTQDYIKAADYIITKAGWGTVAEAICAQKPMLVLRRDEVVEDRVTFKKLMDLEIALPITNEELNANRILELLKKLKTKKENYKYLSCRYSNCSGQIAEQLLKVLYGGAFESGKEQ